MSQDEFNKIKKIIEENINEGKTIEELISVFTKEKIDSEILNDFEGNFQEELNSPCKDQNYRIKDWLQFRENCNTNEDIDEGVSTVSETQNASITIRKGNPEEESSEDSPKFSDGFIEAITNSLSFKYDKFYLSDTNPVEWADSDHSGEKLKVIKKVDWSEWHHETRPFVLKQKHDLFSAETASEPAADKPDTATVNLPDIKRILVVDEELAGDAAQQDILSTFFLKYMQGHDWIDVRYVKNPDDAHQRLKEEEFDYLIMVGKEQGNNQGYHTENLITSLFEYTKDIVKILIKVSGNFNKSDNYKLVNTVRELETALTPEKTETSTGQSNSATSAVDSSLRNSIPLRRLITYYRALPYDIFSALIRKKNPAIGGILGKWVNIVKDGKLSLSDARSDSGKSIFLSPALHKTKELDKLLEECGNSSTQQSGDKDKNKNFEPCPADSSKTTLLWHNPPQDQAKNGAASSEGENGNSKKTTVPPPPYGTICAPEKTASKNLSSLIAAAATPLTGVSAIGHEHAIEVLVDKVKTLLDGPFKEVVLKTVYQDYAEDNSKNPAKTIHWPELQAQSHHRARCLRSREQTRTLWNTGKTALESLTPEMMGEFVRKFSTVNELKPYASRIIVSLGSKFPREKEEQRAYRSHQPVFHKDYFEQDVEKIWRKLFWDVFWSQTVSIDTPVEYCKLEDPDALLPQTESPKDKPKVIPQGITIRQDELTNFSWVEINVRHYLRECVAFHLGGNEYLSPAKIGDLFTGNYAQMQEEFVCWLGVIDKVAKLWHKKVLLKLPFRGDLFHFLHEIITFYNYHKDESGYGIQGITLINAFKSAISENQAKTPFSPAWYGMTTAWGDAMEKRWKYQMSGEMLNASRNELLYAVVTEICKTDMALHISGGVVSKDDIRFLANMVEENNPKKTEDLKIQIGTWGLIDLNLAKDTLDRSCAKDAPPDGNGHPIVVKCCDCPNCAAQTACPHGALTKKSNNPAVIDPAKCQNCKACLNACPHDAIELSRGLVHIENKKPDFAWGGDNVEENHKPEKGEHIIKTFANVPDPEKGDHKCIKKCSAIQACTHNALTNSNDKLTLDESKCVHCLNCINACLPNKNGNSLGLTQKTITISTTRYSDIIQPRIAFWLHDLCNGCGKCSRTFYCDSFLDRRGLDGPPLMDTRNCTGCGLCVQTCPQGALQLFEPKHMAILLSDKDDTLLAWHQFLTAEQIPHLLYSKTQLDNAWKYFEDRRNKAKDDEKEKDVIAWRCKCDRCTELYGKDGYKDERDAGKINDLLGKIPKSQDLNLLKLWYSLALSDPGQILKDSPVILATDKNKAQVYVMAKDKISKKQDKLSATAEVLRSCEALKGIRADVAARLSNLREEKR